MDALILQKIQKDLKALLEEHVLRIDDNDDVKVSFLAPDSDFVSNLGSTPTVNCYLIGIEEDLLRRQSEPLRTQLKNDQKGRKVSAVSYEPRFVDISYMLTVWCQDKTSSAEIEHLLMGYLITGLGGSDFFPGAELSSPNVEPMPYGIRMMLFGSEYAGKISGQVWQAMGATPKPCLMLSLSVPIDVRNKSVRPVIETIEQTAKNTNPSHPDKTDSTLIQEQ
ncbi:DUF4255 domain-containing protein [Vibrio quintilis]|uniref:Pvc16 N-terminal domain-containing protein n=1 Tax=Vibrio quintilis TaxID=1117707 RepID=A0A1M7YU65_9VIBR|nr:DUF4255 domain-containing protein [Vibrio quintilis]SHO56210.1 hypothetical protein VQ7734_01979 [Vibrio quintilis]